MPSFSLEHGILRRGGARAGDARVIGLDESGRGPLAGPVVAAAAWLDPGRCPRRLRRGLDDCKLLAPELRLEFYDRLRDCAASGRAAFAVGIASVVEIDAINILRASLRAMARAAAELERQSGIPALAALVDGPHVPELPCRAEGVVAADQISLSVAAASVVAKVTRDRLMEALALDHPGYGWEHNRGYGTPDHHAALRCLGITPEHRRSFRPVREVLGLSL